MILVRLSAYLEMNDLQIQFHQLEHLKNYS